MANITEALGASIKSKVLGVAAAGKVEKAQANPNAMLKIISKNFMAIPGFARDLNVARQGIQQLVKIEGGTPAKGADAHFLKAAEREKKLEVETAEKAPTQVKKKTGPSKLSKLKKQFSEKNILSKIMKYVALPVIIGGIFIAFKDSFIEWASGLWETIKEAFDGFVEKIKEWFNEVVVPIVETVKSFIDEWYVQPIKSFFGKITEFFVGYFQTWYNLITSPMETVKNIYDSFASKVNKVAEFLGLKKKEETPPKPSASSWDPDAASRKVHEEMMAKKKEVEKLEKEKQYTGRDTIVRKRLGLPEVAAADMPTEPILVPGAAPKPSVSAPTVSKPAIKETPQPASKQPSAAAPSVSGMDDVKAMVIKHEGIRYKPYKDSLGLWTIGVGHLIGDGKSLPPEYNREFSKDEVMSMFEKDFAHHVKIAEQTPGYQQANQGGKAAFIDLAFNMGKWWPKWPTTKKNLQAGDFEAAAQGLQDSRWYEQVKGRAKTIVGLVAQAGNGAGNGGEIGSASTMLASGQRQQMKSSTPMVVNAPTNNTQIVKKTEIAAKKADDPMQDMVGAAA